VDLASAEFVAVDVETNGRAGDDCEITEVGAVLVGGGELHDRYESLVRVEYPLTRGIERFTGITQAMLADAPPPAAVLGELRSLIGDRVLVAHSAAFDRRVLAHAFDRAGLAWPDPPAICTLALARRFAPLATERKLVPLAEALGIEPAGAHRALVDAETCARVFCALFPKLCARAATVADALALLAPRRAKRRQGRKRPPSERPDLGSLPDDPGVYIFRDARGRPVYVGKSVSVRSRARAHFCAPAEWTDRAETVDYRPTNSELGALLLENRLIKRWRPAGNRKLKRTNGYVYIRARLDIPFPVLEVADEPASGLALNVGPLRGRPEAATLVDQLNSLFRLRHCGRRLKLREHPSAYGQMGRCLSPCLGDLDPNLYRRRLEEALEAVSSSDDLLERLRTQVRDASAAQRYEHAAVVQRQHDRLAVVLDRLGGLFEAVGSRSRIVLARHPMKERFDAFVVVGGRTAWWGPFEGARALAERAGAALAAARRSPLVAPEEVDEIRIVRGWLAAHEPPQLVLEGDQSVETIARWVETASSGEKAA
jgi:DNA polymerase III subunit epsilon